MVTPPHGSNGDPTEERRGTSPPPSSERPAQIGPYKILDTLGEGGMGKVYLAEQHSPVKRRVALKLVKLGMDSKAVVARFEQERQALAMMDHEGIAKVFDCGVTERGQLLEQVTAVLRTHRREHPKDPFLPLVLPVVVHANQQP